LLFVHYRRSKRSVNGARIDPGRHNLRISALRPKPLLTYDWRRDSSHREGCDRSRSLSLGGHRGA
jgi:hypothetical protein